MSEKSDRDKYKVEAIGGYMTALRQAELTHDVYGAREALEHLQGVLGGMADGRVNHKTAELQVIGGCYPHLKTLARAINRGDDVDKHAKQMFDEVCALIRMWGGKP